MIWGNERPSTFAGNECPTLSGLAAVVVLTKPVDVGDVGDPDVGPRIAVVLLEPHGP